MRETSGGVAIDFIYDADGRPFAMKRNGVYYYYILNLQGDVIRLINSNGATVASYEYDPYGKVISATGSMASINPLRYRGYYYDQETGLYFLMSRYYDPAICRFINADEYASTGQGLLGFNMFAYCGNNPVMRIDPTGNSPVHILLAGTALFCAAVVVGITHVENYLNAKRIEKDIQSSYTRETAMAEINSILSPGNHVMLYNDDVEEVRLSSSYKVTSKYVRQKVSMILERTDGLTSREFDNISAEWKLHNDLYYVTSAVNAWTNYSFQPIIGFQESAAHVDINYQRDYRIYVVLLTKIYEIFGWE